MEQQNRHWGLDSMRVVCMLSIVLYHLQGHGNLIAGEGISPVNHTGILMSQAILQAAIDSFSLISGYIGYDRGQKYTSLVMLWLRVLFYSVGITFAVWLVSPGVVSYADITSAFFPLLPGRYWYFTAYVGCFVLAPLVRTAIAHLPRKEAAASLLGIVAVFSLLPYLMRNDPFLTSRGNHALWLLILYALGCYVRAHDPFARLSTRKLLALLLAACIVQAGSGFVVPPVSRLLTGRAATRWYFICNDSPTTLALSVLALAFFSRLPARRSTPFFRMLVSGSFSVYLIHDHPLIRQHVIMPLGTRLAALPAPLLMPSILAAGMAIYGVCACVDLLRERLFTLLRIRPFLLRLEGRLLGRGPGGRP